jgi:hypothetical protein
MLREAGGAAADLPDSVASIFAEDFEKGMDEVWLNHNERTSALLRQLARLFAPYEPRQGNAYIELLRILGGTQKKAVLATTNYDLLIERAISMCGLRTTYTALPVGVDNIPVLKIHGSCHFLPDVQPGALSGFSVVLPADFQGGIVGSRTKLARSTEEIYQFCDNEDVLAPGVAMYHPSKRVLFCKDFVAQQQRHFHAAIKAAARVFVVGLRVHLIDVHIWEPLAAAKAPVYYVGREPSEFLAWAKAKRRSASAVLGTAFTEALPNIASAIGAR